MICVCIFYFPLLYVHTLLYIAIVLCNMVKMIHFSKVIELEPGIFMIMDSQIKHTLFC